MEAGGDSLRLHIVVFPWLAFGHMLPSLELSKSLARRGHRISFISTPRNIHRLPKVPSDVSHSLHLVPLILPHVDGKPEDAEATSDLPTGDQDYLMKALDGLEQPFSTFLRDSSPKPDWIVQDFFQHWIPKIATDSGIPSLCFVSLTAAALTFIGKPADMATRGIETFTSSPPWVPFPSKVAYRLHEIVELSAGPDRPSAAAASLVERMEVVIGDSPAVAIRSCAELEGEWLPVLEQLYGKPVLPVGLLPPPPNSYSSADQESDVLQWLAGRGLPGSVVYAALGSEVTMSAELTKELALGLELAGLPFLWALGRPFGSSPHREILPEGFEERTRGFGKVARGWVPQLEVLAHSAVGGFLTHCGLGSIIEGLHFGRPLILMPVRGDQGLNARLLEEKGIGVEVERKEDGSFTRNEVAKAVELVMVEEDGGSYREKAREAKGFANKECQDKYVDKLVEYLLTHRTTTS
nr:glucosyltransferase [Crocus sativus]